MHILFWFCVVLSVLSGAFGVLIAVENRSDDADDMGADIIPALLAITTGGVAIVGWIIYGLLRVWGGA